MTLADATMGATAAFAAGGFCVTVSFSSDFLAGVKQGDLLRSRADCTRQTKRLVFLRGSVSAARPPGGSEVIDADASELKWGDVFTYSGVFARLEPKL